MSHHASEESPRRPRFWEALIPVVALIGLIGLNIVIFGGEAHIPLVLASGVAGLVGYYLGYSWHSLQQGIAETISIALNAILILLAIGILVGTWIVSGVVPMLIFYGLELLSPQLFLVAACVVCAVVSLATGSSWTTAATVGVALIGVGKGLGVPLPMAAGAIVSGAYFGDKMSPLSDTTNLAPAATGVDLFEHIRHMALTTGPALGIALILFGVLGSFLAVGDAEASTMATIQATIENEFDLSLSLAVPPLVVLVLVVMRVPALPALLAGALLGGVGGMAIQGTSIGSVITVAHHGYVSETGIDSVDALLTRGGLTSMMSTVALILCALAFGGLMERTGMLEALAAAVLRTAHSVGGLIAATVVTCIGTNVVAPDQYLSIILPGRMYREAYRARGLHAKNLSRTLEDGGTLSSPLVPWNTCGAYMYGALGVSPFAYLPFAFLNIITPLVAIVFGFTGWTMTRLVSASEAEGSSPRT